ncbi:MAG: HAMP domain-containing protein [candidate division Zixibacteria bacterium]|nr:HAMP domain-containing protein [candidate division Zixibacteria bacterium]
MRLNIQAKAVISISVLTTALTISLTALPLYHCSRAVRTQLLMRGTISTKNLAYNAAYAALIGDTVSIVDLLNGVMAEKEVLYARIVEPDGRILAQRDRTGSGPQSGATQTIDPASPEGVDLTAARADDGIVHLQIPVTIRQQPANNLGAELGTEWGAGVEGDDSTRTVAYAQVGITSRYAEATIRQMRNYMIGTSLLLTLLAIVITSVFIRWSIRPVNALVIATGRVAGGDYDCKVEVENNDEVGDLALSFNKMTTDLKASRDALVEKDLLEELVLELRQTQQQLVQAGKMAAIGQLAAGVAHEINNPLAGIMGYAQLAAEHMRTKQTTGIPPAELAKFLNYIDNMEKQSQRCKQIVQNLLRFARASSREDLEPVDCNAVLRNTLDFMKHQMIAAGIACETRHADNLPAVAGHSGKMQQVLTNILINAVQAIKGGGRIAAQTRFRESMVEIVITDTGAGIPPENLERVFEPFFTTKEIGQGTGLGLSVTYGLVKDMGGHIGVESTVGVGTTFTITFPKVEAEKMPPSARPDRTHPTDVPASEIPSNA